jgi:CheY-like chemotaxis protein
VAGDTVSGSSSDPMHSILVVEDEVLIRLVLAAHLRGCGYRVIEAASGEEAVQVLESDQNLEVLFTDVHLPGAIDGFALSRWAKRLRPGIKVVITSGTERAAQQASDLCDDEPYLTKPYDPAALVREIRRLLGARGP